MIRCLLLTMSLLSATRAFGDDLKLGLVGCDTSHATAFTALLNDEKHPKHVAGARVVAAVKTFSADVPSSASRVDGYEKELKEKWGVHFVLTVEELCTQVDAVLIESVDGRPHLEQVRPVLAAKKPVFIDKPIAGSLKDAVEIVRLAKAAGVPCFSASAYRYYDSMVELKKADIGNLRGAVSYGPGPKEEHHPDLYWYGIHPSEALFVVLGRGCESVTRTSAEDADVVTGLWSGGRTGVLVALRTKATPHQVTLFGDKAVAQQKSGGDDYAPLVAEIVKCFQTNVAPVPLEETLELFAFMEAADESKRRGGVPVKISEVLEKAGGK